MDIATSRVKISLAETQFLAAVTEALGSRFGEACSWIIDNVDKGQPLGTIRASRLTESQFEAQKNTPHWNASFPTATTWVLCDGKSITGSALQTTLGFSTAPDLVNKYLRGKNHDRSTSTGNAAGDLALGTAQLDDYKSHIHTPTYLNTQFPLAHTDTGLDRDSNPFTEWRVSPSFISLSATISGVANQADNKGGSNFPRSAIVNFFIKVN